MSNFVFVLDANKQPLNPYQPLFLMKEAIAFTNAIALSLKI